MNSAVSAVANEGAMRELDGDLIEITHETADRIFAMVDTIEMTPLCNRGVTLPRVLGSRRVHRGGVVDEQAGVQPS
jgi:hypothetical protein